MYGLIVSAKKFLMLFWKCCEIFLLNRVMGDYDQFCTFKVLLTKLVFNLERGIDYNWPEY